MSGDRSNVGFAEIAITKKLIKSYLKARAVKKKSVKSSLSSTSKEAVLVMQKKRGGTMVLKHGGRRRSKFYSDSKQESGGASKRGVGSDQEKRSQERKARMSLSPSMSPARRNGVSFISPVSGGSKKFDKNNTKGKGGSESTTFRSKRAVALEGIKKAHRHFRLFCYLGDEFREGGKGSHVDEVNDSLIVWNEKDDGNIDFEQAVGEKKKQLLRWVKTKDDVAGMSNIASLLLLGSDRAEMQEGISPDHPIWNYMAESWETAERKDTARVKAGELLLLKSSTQPLSILSTDDEVAAFVSIIEHHWAKWLVTMRKTMQEKLEKEEDQGNSSNKSDADMIRQMDIIQFLQRFGDKRVKQEWEERVRQVMGFWWKEEKYATLRETLTEILIGD